MQHQKKANITRCSQAVTHANYEELRPKRYSSSNRRMPTAKATINAAKKEQTKPRTKTDPDWRKSTTRTRVEQNTSARDAATQLEARFLSQAEEIWTRAVQKECFERELPELRARRPPPRGSRLQSLSIYVSPEGLLRLNSRIDAAKDVLTMTKAPPVIDDDHPYTYTVAYTSRQPTNACTIEA
ncbi:hypothetical protein EVAR_78109_1 [Eumeta japonica]|uniref:Uncharacterized protein n=1 Tax=Eumeta variegata TaxID=151549 RepID=A0A4C1T1H0_EUMVA|nr:hypothetical protein EVAR_78109_1 [Eumeta japonica]